MKLHEHEMFIKRVRFMFRVMLEIATRGMRMCRLGWSMGLEGCLDLHLQLIICDFLCYDLVSNSQ